MIASPFPQKPRVAALIVAGGRGARAATADDASPKQYRMLGGVPVIARTIAVFDGHPSVDAVVAVIHADDDAAFYAATQDRARADAVVIGGASRQDSVLRGLEHLAKARQRPDIVLIHDAVRPFLDPAVIDRLIAALHDHAGAIAALPAVDTLKAERPDGTIARTVPRAGLWAAQTPQAFVFSTILDAHLAARDMGLSDFTDDAAVAEWRGIDVALVAGNAENVKLTTAADIAIADEHLNRENLMALADIRTGTGFDVHAFSEGRSVTLCGVEIAHDHTLHGHSDADVAMHALTDALFGALAAGDIGSHFPPSDPQWKGAASRVFLERAVALVGERGGRIAHVDLTIICEAPKIGPHRDAMRARLAEICGIEIDRVSVKATTTERLGFTGRREGIAAMASATVRLPAEA